jgi:hypothetical protein
MGPEIVEYINLHPDAEEERALVNATMNFTVPQNVGNF